MVSKSKKLFDQAKKIIPSGVNSPVRFFKPYPFFVKKSQGSSIWDEDGRRYIDYCNGYGALLLGHARKEIISAVSSQLKKGTLYTTPTALEVELSKLIIKNFPSMGKVRLVNTGAEATMTAIRLARGFTKKKKIIKFEGCYHGSVDPLLVQAGSGAMTLGIPDSPGVPASFVEHTLQAKFNDLDSVIKLVEENSSKIAAVIIEPVAGNMGMIPPEHGFLQGLRDLCDREGILLIFDEVMSGFRVDYGGAQALFGVLPDMSIFGKIIGGGLPVGAYGGRQDIMLQVAPAGPVYQAGTLSGNPLAVAAGLSTLEILREENPYPELGQKTSWLSGEFQSAAESAGVPLQTQAMGGMFGFFFSETPVRNYQDALNSDVERFTQFFRSMLNQGIYLAPSAFESLFVSTAHSEKDLERTARAFRKALQEK